MTLEGLPEHEDHSPFLGPGRALCTAEGSGGLGQEIDAATASLL